MLKIKKEILIATENKGKIKEMQKIFAGTDFLPRFLSEFQEQMAEVAILENAKTFEGNALIKAIVVGERLGMLTLADDSGICVAALDGAPGVYSARYSKEKTDSANNAKLLAEMARVPEEQRDCYYNCTVAIYDPVTQFVETVSGQWHGRVALAPRGEKSFGYAPIFLSRESGHKKTNAEFDPEELIDINHRGKAFRGAMEILKGYIAAQ
ncbi:MAG: RdgB/HAM1 family non-canonical purine NTP pyrophosphatase [Parcubacteria group bacterium]|jgi:XTP/dITP diphosphohydrolase